MHIANSNAALAPFHNIVNYILLRADFVEQLCRPHRSFTIAMIFPYDNEQDVGHFIQGYVLMHRSAELLHIFSNNNYTSNLRALCGARLISCGRITHMTTRQIREICARTNDLNIAYCENYRLKHENADNIGLANLFAVQKHERIRLQLQYNAILRREITQQFLP